MTWPNSGFSIMENLQNLLKVPSLGDNNKMVDRAFSHAAPKLWNSIPDRVRTCKSLESFKKSLTTHLFQECYG